MLAPLQFCLNLLTRTWPGLTHTQIQSIVIDTINKESKTIDEVDPILGIGALAACLEKCCHAACGDGVLMVMERISGQAHHLADFGGIAQFSGEIQLADLVADDVLVETGHGITPWRVARCFDKDLHRYQNG